MKNKSKIRKTKVQNYNDGRTSLNLLSQFKNWGKNLVNPARLLVADMQLNNGDTELHVVEVRNDTFTLFGGRYIVNPEYLRYNRTLKMYVCKYHEGLSIPIKQHINVNAIKDALRDSAEGEVDDVINNVDPIILEALVKSTIIQKVFNGAEMQDVFGFLKVLSVIILLVSGITCLIVISTSGIF